MSICRPSAVGALRNSEDFQQVGQRIRAGYEEIAPQYRRDDEIEVTSANHRRLESILNLMTSSFRRPIEVLDVGCGTGRYFHCLRNVERLLGMDISPEMLRGAGTPVRQEQITAKKIELICANIYFASFPERSFDLIFSLGMFGHGCPATTELCNKFFWWLKPGGKLFFNAVDELGMPFQERSRRRLRQKIYRSLPQRLRRILDERERMLPFFALTRTELERTMQRTHFTEFHVSSHNCQSPLWQGRHLECLAEKAV